MYWNTSACYFTWGFYNVYNFNQLEENTTDFVLKIYFLYYYILMCSQRIILISYNQQYN